jgi:hypothetical protein
MCINLLNQEPERQLQKTAQITYKIHRWHLKMTAHKHLQRRYHKMEVLKAKHKILNVTRALENKQIQKEGNCKI